jgi:hypothetical protein
VPAGAQGPIFARRTLLTPYDADDVITSTNGDGNGHTSLTNYADDDRVAGRGMATFTCYDADGNVTESTDELLPLRQISLLLSA